MRERRDGTGGNNRIRVKESEEREFLKNVCRKTRLAPPANH